MRRLAEGAAELAAEVGAREARGAAAISSTPERLDVAGVGQVLGAQQVPGGRDERHRSQSRLAGLVIGTYAAALAVCGASLAIGQAAIALCGAAPLVVARAGGRAGAALRGLLGDGAAARATGSISAIVVLALTRRLGRLPAGDGWRAGGRRCAPAGRSPLLALLAASLPFVVEGHFGILGTSFNPDMSQHLLTADRLAHGQGSAAAPPGLPARPALDRRRPQQGTRHRPGPGLQRPHGRRRGPRPADRPRRLPRAQRRCRGPPALSSSASPTWSPPTSPRAPSRRRCRRSSCSPSSSRCASRPASLARPPAALRPGRPARGRLRLHLQLPRPALAARHRGHLGGRGVVRRARSRGGDRSSAPRRCGPARRPLAARRPRRPRSSWSPPRSAG